MSRFFKKDWYLLAAVTCLLVGGYGLVDTLAPGLPQRPQQIAVRREQVRREPAAREDRLYIPALGVDVAIVEGASSAVLEKGAWHRKPESGDPAQGGNFVLSAHRFRLGWTPQGTRARSPFYRLDRLQPGDQIFVDYRQRRYTYIVSETYKVDRHAIEIEARSSTPKLTLYSCNLRGERAGREVVEAVPRL